MTEPDLGYDLKKGDLIQNTYEILEPLGRGGMGATYKARHTAMGHLVAVKVINAELCNDKRALELFKREANLMRDLGKSAAAEAIVKIETLLQDGSGTHYLIMEFIDGQPLSYYTSKGARLRDEDLLAFANRMIAALGAIHQKGIIHRDISPDNIMVPDENILEAKILDFGVATDTIDTEKSILGETFAGKIGYASPEQLGLFGEKVTGKSDFYSLGLVLLTTAGIKPPGKGSMATAIEERKVDIDLSDSNLSPKARKLIEGLLIADPARRTGASDPEASPSLTQVINRTEMHMAEGENAVSSQGKSRGALFVVAAVVVAAIGIGGYLLSPKVQSGGGTETAAVKAASEDSTAPQPSAQAPTASQPPPVAESQAPAMETPPNQPATGGLTLPKIAELAGRVLSPVPPSTADPEVAPQQQAHASPQSQTAKPAQPAPKSDPFPNILALMEVGGQESLQVAEQSLVRLASNANTHPAHQSKAAFMLGRMNDPKFHNSKVSTRATADASAALRYYETARGLGFSGLDADIKRLRGATANN